MFFHILSTFPFWDSGPSTKISRIFEPPLAETLQDSSTPRQYSATFSSPPRPGILRNSIPLYGCVEQIRAPLDGNVQRIRISAREPAVNLHLQSPRHIERGRHFSGDQHKRSRTGSVEYSDIVLTLDQLLGSCPLHYNSGSCNTREIRRQSQYLPRSYKSSVLRYSTIDVDYRLQLE